MKAPIARPRSAVGPAAGPVGRGVAALWCALRLAAAIGGGCVCALPTNAADDNRLLYPVTNVPTGPVAGGNLGGVALAVGLVLAAVGVWLVRRGRRAAPRYGDGQGLAIAETRSLGNRQYLVVATYAEKKFLLGVCPGRIDLLASLSEEKNRP